MDEKYIKPFAADIKPAIDPDRGTGRSTRLIERGVYWARNGYGVCLVFARTAESKQAADLACAYMAANQIGFQRIGVREINLGVGRLSFKAMGDQNAGSRYDFVDFDHAALDNTPPATAVEWRDSWQQCGKSIPQTPDLSRLSVTLAPKPTFVLPPFELRPKDAMGIHVEANVNGFVVSCSAFEGNHFKGLSFVADARSLPSVIEQVQAKQRAAILEFFAPKASEAAEPCST